MLPIRVSQKDCKEKKLVLFVSAWICRADVEPAFDLSEQRICIHSIELIVS